MLPHCCLNGFLEGYVFMFFLSSCLFAIGSSWIFSRVSKGFNWFSRVFIGFRDIRGGLVGCSLVFQGFHWFFRVSTRDFVGFLGFP